MLWISLYVALGLIGLGVLAAVAMRVFAAVRELGQEVERSQRRLEPKLAELEEKSARINQAAS